MRAGPLSKGVERDVSIKTNQPWPDRVPRDLDEEGRRLTVVQVHPDAGSMEFHMQVNAKHFVTEQDHLDTIVSEQHYGAISDALAAELAKWDDPDVVVTKIAGHEGGFTRTDVR